MSDSATEFRVSSWDDFIGQEALKERLDVHIQAALGRKAHRLDAVFLHSPPGYGKTTLAGIIARRFGNRPFHDYTMPISDKALKDLVTTGIGVVLFDEIHRATPKQQENLLTLVNGNYITMQNGYRLENPDLTIIGATTERDKVIKPLYDRFFIKPDFVRYSDREMGRIARNMLASAKLDMPDEYVMAIGKAAGGVPRRIADMVAMARDLKATGKDFSINEVLRFCGLTADGLTRAHLEYMQLVHSNSKPLGLSNLSSNLQLSASMVIDLESLLVRRGWLSYETQGRDLTGEGHARIRRFIKEGE